MPKKQHITPPEGGWKEQTFYEVKVKFCRANVEHKSLFYTGFLHEGNPAGYNQLMNPCYESGDDLKIGSVYSLKVIRELDINLKGGGE